MYAASYFLMLYIVLKEVSLLAAQGSCALFNVRRNTVARMMRPTILHALHKFNARVTSPSFAFDMDFAKDFAIETFNAYLFSNLIDDSGNLATCIIDLGRVFNSLCAFVAVSRTIYNGIR
jgi:hypothetical protein